MNEIVSVMYQISQFNKWHLSVYIGIGRILAGRINVSIKCNVMDTYLLDIPSR